ncbi:MAG TPA: PEP-CTERM sorting domain-containing protein [Acetobacteraceae bacterium]|nr:PEP-CTERM sorting domain-containing protein [Acetobacteraceae bacterium]
MVRFQRAGLAAVALIGLGTVAAPAFATQIYVDNVALPYSETLNLNGYIDGSSKSESSLAGQIVLTVNDGSTASSNTYTLPVWCVDIFHNISLGNSGDYVYNEGPLSNDHSNNPTTLSSTQITDIADLATYGDHLMQTSPSNQTSAEVQAAIWTVEYNANQLAPALQSDCTSGGPNCLYIGGGSFNSSDINTLIGNAVAYGGSATQLLSISGAQAEVFDASVPEPASFGLLGAGLFGLAFARRRKA